MKPAAAPRSGSTFAATVAAVIVALIVVAAAGFGFDAIERARDRTLRLRDAIGLADALGQAAGRDGVNAGSLKRAASELSRSHGHRLGVLFATAAGGEDEFGIARGAMLTVGGDDFSANDQIRVLEHGGALTSVATGAVRDNTQVPWQRLLGQLADGRRLVAVAWRPKANAPIGGVAGIALPADSAGLVLPTWRWSIALFAALLLVGGLRAGLPGRICGLVVGLLSAAAAIASTPAMSEVGGGGVQILAAELLIAHGSPPPATALMQAEAWLGFGLLVIGGALGAAAPATAQVIAAMRRDITPYLYVGPALLATCVLVFVPFGVGVGLSFVDVDGAFNGATNYQSVLATLFESDESTQLGRTFLHTLLWTALNVVAHVVIGLSLALVLNRPHLRGRKIYRLLLIVPWAVPNYITALTWKWLFNTQYGPINAMLSAAGIERIDWLGDSGFTAFAANLATNIWLGFPFMMVISLGALQSIPAELYEAADIDGASSWQKLRHVTLPLLRPALFPAVILGTIWTFNAFNIIYLVSGGGPDHKTEILITEAYYLFTVLRRTGLAAAYSVLIFGFLLAYTLLTNRLTKATEAVD